MKEAPVVDKIPVTEIQSQSGTSSVESIEPSDPAFLSRRHFLKNSARLSAASLSGAAALITGCDNGEAHSSWAEFFQTQYRLMSDAEKAQTVARLERRYSSEYGQPVSVDTAGAEGNVLFGYALNLKTCIGCRRCVKACSLENNQSRAEGEEIEWIRVLKTQQHEFSQQASGGDHRDNEALHPRANSQYGAEVNAQSEHYYRAEKVPEANAFYTPMACMQCDNPPCVKVCPVKATYREPDGIVVIDYNWCIGCRLCMQACPYWARRFNWKKPHLPSENMNPKTHYLGNRPRMQGVVEKCTFCIQRVRRGRYPACVEACPVGARKFGNLLDPQSEVRKVLANKKVFRLKEELHTEPKFFYFVD